MTTCKMQAKSETQQECKEKVKIHEGDMLNVTTCQWRRKFAKETHYKQTFQNIVCKSKVKHNESAFALAMEF
jgi:hypothetical protein